MKKGVTLLAMIITLLFLIGVAFIGAGLILKIKMMQNIGLRAQQQYKLTVSGAHLPVIYQSALSAAIDVTIVDGYRLAYLLTKADPQDCTKDIEIYKSILVRDIVEWNKIGTGLAANVQLDKNIILAVETDRETKEIYSTKKTLAGVRYNIYKIIYNMLPTTNCRLVMYVLEPGD